MARTKSASTKAAQDGRPFQLTSRRIDLDAEVRSEMSALLNQALADAFDLFSQTKQAHWNVKGAQFHQLHELYDELAEGLEEHVDMIAERVTALGGIALGTARLAAQSSRLAEFPDTPVGSLESVQLLVERYAAFAKAMRESIEKSEEAGDSGTADLFTEVVRDVDKWSWFLEAHLQETDRP